MAATSPLIVVAYPLEVPFFDLFSTALLVNPLWTNPISFSVLPVFTGCIDYWLRPPFHYPCSFPALSLWPFAPFTAFLCISPRLTLAVSGLEGSRRSYKTPSYRFALSDPIFFSLTVSFSVSNRINLVLLEQALRERLFFPTRTFPLSRYFFLPSLLLDFFLWRFPKKCWPSYKRCLMRATLLFLLLDVFSTHSPLPLFFNSLIWENTQTVRFVEVAL